MLQVKISAVIVTVVAALTAFACVALGNRIGADVIVDEVAELAVASRAASSAHQLAESSLELQVDALAHDPTVVQELTRLRGMVLERGDVEPLKDQLNRATLFASLLEGNKELSRRLETDYGKPQSSDAARIHTASLERPIQDWWGSAPDLVLAFVATPLRGERVAYALVAHAEEGQELAAPLDYAAAQPLLGASEAGAVGGVMNWNDRHYLAAVAPVFDASGTRVGAVVQGFLLGAELADRLGSFTGGELDLILFSDLVLFGPTRAGYRAELPGARFHRVADDGSIGDEDVAFEALDGDAAYVTEIGGQRLLVRRHSWQPAAAEHAGVGFLVVEDLDAPLASVDGLVTQLVIVAAVLLVLALIAVMLFVRRFTAPFEQVIVGLQEVAGGNHEVAFQPRPGNRLQSAMAEQLNQLVPRLSGADAAAPVSAHDWDRMMVDLEPERPSMFGLAAVPRMGDDKERDALRSLYDEYMARRRELGQHVDMDFDRFCRRIKRNESRLREKHNATAVRFAVAVADGKVVLKPTLHFD